ncbi:MAG: hypothetical protein KF882_05740 [Bacteroidia bacterium]|nr:hypothetical protein [Bacteroidia bacterium]MCO5254855.1 hypothetical protein [Bacteroidota bacterium]
MAQYKNYYASIGLNLSPIKGAKFTDIELRYKFWTDQEDEGVYINLHYQNGTHPKLGYIVSYYKSVRAITLGVGYFF